MSNYPAGVDDSVIDAQFPPDEPEDEPQITPRQILSGLIQYAEPEGRAILERAWDYLWRQHRIDNDSGYSRLAEWLESERKRRDK